jgi:hypothetical protein
MQVGWPKIAAGFQLAREMRFLLQAEPAAMQRGLSGTEN